MRVFQFLTVSFSALFLSGCVAAAVGASGVIGYSAAQERSVGNAIDDTTILTRVKHNYLQKDVNHLFHAVDVDVYEGRVLLKGHVIHPDHRVEAIRLAWAVPGVTEVISEIQLDGQPISPSRQAKDEWTTAKISGRLLITKGVRSINYNIDTVNGIVYIIGIADSREELDKVLDITRRMDDVKKVVSHVRIKTDPLRNMPNGGTQPEAKK